MLKISRFVVVVFAVALLWGGGSFLSAPSAHAATGPIPRSPDIIPNECPNVVSSVTNVSRSATDLKYDLFVAVKNTCTQTLTTGALTMAFQLDCSGVLIDQEPDVNRNFTNLGVGKQVGLYDQAEDAFCLEDGVKVAPVEQTIFATASGDLANGQSGQTTTTIEIS